MNLNEIKNLAILYCIRVITFDYLVIKRVLKSEIPKGNISVLDLGSGSGYFAKMFNKKTYLGVDIDPNSISLAKKLYPQYKFEVKDIASSKIKDKFEVVLIIGVLHHLNNTQMEYTLETTANALKRNGKAIIIEAIPPILNFNLLGKLLRSIDQGRHIRRSENYLQIMKKKFDIIHSKEVMGGFVDYAVFTLSNKAP